MGLLLNPINVLHDGVHPHVQVCRAFFSLVS
jgi:hypothetical protein